MKKVVVETCYFLFLIAWFVVPAYAASGLRSRVMLNPYAKDFDPTTCKRFGIVLNVSSEPDAIFAPDFIKDALGVYGAYNTRILDAKTVIGSFQYTFEEYILNKPTIVAGLKLMDVQSLTFYQQRSDQSFVKIEDKNFADDNKFRKPSVLEASYFLSK